MEPDGSHVTRLTDNNFGDSPCIQPWSPDSEHLAFESDQDGNGNIVYSVMDADGNHVIQLTDNSSAHLAGCYWSTDGEYLAFSLVGMEIMKST